MTQYNINQSYGNYQAGYAGPGGYPGPIGGYPAPSIGGYAGPGGYPGGSLSSVPDGGYTPSYTVPSAPLDESESGSLVPVYTYTNHE